MNITIHFTSLRNKQYKIEILYTVNDRLRRQDLNCRIQSELRDWKIKRGD